MLKISEAGKASRAVILKLEGQVVGPWVEELRQVCDTLLTKRRKLKLDLADVSFADTSGVLALASFKSRGVSLTNCSPFVKEQLKGPIRS